MKGFKLDRNRSPDGHSSNEFSNTETMPMRAILVLASITLVAYGVLVFLITLGFATQVDPSLTGSAWRVAVLTRLFGNLKVGLLMSVGGLALGVGLYLWAQRTGNDRKT